MEIRLFLEDLADDTIDRIKWAIRSELAEDLGVDPEHVDEEAVEDYLNRHNVGVSYEL